MIVAAARLLPEPLLRVAQDVGARDANGLHPLEQPQEVLRAELQARQAAAPLRRVAGLQRLQEVVDEAEARVGRGGKALGLAIELDTKDALRHGAVWGSGRAILRTLVRGGPLDPPDVSPAIHVTFVTPCPSLLFHRLLQETGSCAPLCALAFCQERAGSGYANRNESTRPTGLTWRVDNHGQIWEDKDAPNPRALRDLARGPGVARLRALTTSAFGMTALPQRALRPQAHRAGAGCLPVTCPEFRALS